MMDHERNKTGIAQTAERTVFCGAAISRVLIGTAPTAITFQFLCLNYILPTVGILLQLLGFRVLRRENRWFGACFVLSVIRAVYLAASLILNTTIYGSMVDSAADTGLTVLSLVLMFALLICLQCALLTVKRRTASALHTGGTAALIVWYGAVCVLGLLRIGGWLIAVPLLICYILILCSLFRLAKALDESGCQVPAVPSRIKDAHIAAVFTAILVIGFFCGYRFGGSYLMQWSPLEAAVPGDESVKSQLSSLGFPEAVLNDLAADDLAACKDAVQVIVRTDDQTMNDDRVLRCTGIGVQLPENRWIIFHHFLWTEPMAYHGTEAVRIWPAYHDDTEGWLPDGDVSGRVLCDRDDQTLAADYYSLEAQENASADYFGYGSVRTDLLGAFSMLRGSENQRGYLCYAAQANSADRPLSWINYTHQYSWKQYPAKTAVEQSRPGWNDRAFQTVQTAVRF